MSISSEVLSKINNRLSDLDVSVWARELKGDIDEVYVMEGIKNGFSVVDIQNVIKSCRGK